MADTPRALFSEGRWLIAGWIRDRGVLTLDTSAKAGFDYSRSDRIEGIDVGIRRPE